MTAQEGRSVVEQARALVAEGRTWRARDLLTAHVESTRDPEALSYLGEVLHDMGDLPRAGAVWFAAGAKGADVDAAVAAWREQAGDDFTVMWRSLPAPVREAPRARRVEALRERAQRDAGAADGGLDPEGTGLDAPWALAWVLALIFVVLAVIGFVTVLGWVVPG